MGGGLMQIVVKGPQDFYITNKPKLTYYKNIFKRYVHFSLFGKKNVPYKEEQE